MYAKLITVFLLACAYETEEENIKIVVWRDDQW